VVWLVVFVLSDCVDGALESVMVRLVVVVVSGWVDGTVEYDVVKLVVVVSVESVVEVNKLS
jgi:hypothetical protein